MMMLHALQCILIMSLFLLVVTSQPYIPHFKYNGSDHYQFGRQLGRMPIYYSFAVLLHFTSSFTMALALFFVLIYVVGHEFRALIADRFSKSEFLVVAEEFYQTDAGKKVRIATSQHISSRYASIDKHKLIDMQ
jgi:hypothetical protein